MTALDSLDGVVLAVDASSAQGSAAVVRRGRVAAEATVALRSADEERLVPAIRTALAEARVGAAELTAVACGAGPGSFTGLRIAAATAKGVALARDLPLYPAPSLALAVAAMEPAPPAGTYLVVLDAMRGERFAQAVVVDVDGALRVEAPALLSASDVEALAGRLGARRVGPGEADARAPHARGVARLLPLLRAAGPVALAAWQPDYGRLAEAQVKWEAAHGRTLPVG